MSASGRPRAFQRIVDAVKRGAGRPRTAPAPRDGAQRFEGAPLALVLVGIVALAAALAAPRATEPDVLPLPVPDRRVLAQSWDRDERHRAEVRTRPLSFDVRAVGEAVRRAGVATVLGKGAPEPKLGEIRMLVQRVRGLGNERALLQLRAVQTALFVEATRAWEKSGQVPAELRELSGDFPEQAVGNGWWVGRRLVLDDEERATLFRLRWTELTGLRRVPAFSPSLDEYRAYYALYLTHTRKPGAAERNEDERQKLGIVQTLEKRDPTYPALFARGVLFYRAGLFAASAEAFRAHLAARPDGPWTLRAENHLLAALARLPAAE